MGSTVKSFTIDLPLSIIGGRRLFTKYNTDETPQYFVVGAVIGKFLMSGHDSRCWLVVMLLLSQD